MWYLLECGHYGHDSDEIDRDGVVAETHLHCKTCKNKFRRIVTRVPSVGQKEADVVVRWATVAYDATLELHESGAVTWKKG